VTQVLGVIVKGKVSTYQTHRNNSNSYSNSNSNSYNTSKSNSIEGRVNLAKTTEKLFGKNQNSLLILF